MDFKGPEHVFECVPDVLGIKEQYEAHRLAVKAHKIAKQQAKAQKKKSPPAPRAFEPVTIGLTATHMPEFDAAKLEEAALYLDHERGVAVGKAAEKTVERARKHFRYVKNLTVDGKEVEGFDDFYKRAPRELVGWVLLAVTSTDMLTEAQLKN